MKKILHSGQFLDYDGNTITITFYQEKHLWVSTTIINAPYTGGEYEVEVWSDVGFADIRDFDSDWVSLRSLGSYINADGHTVFRYKIIVEGRGAQIGSERTMTLTAIISDRLGDTTGYEGEPLQKTITITRR